MTTNIELRDKNLYENLYISSNSSVQMLHIRPLVLALLVWTISFIGITVIFFKILIQDITMYKGEIITNEVEFLKKLKGLNEYDQTTEDQIPFIKLNTNLFNISMEVVTEKFKRCTPTNNVVFLKTHKTASSTLTNIFNRYADLRELMVALPAMNDKRFSWPRKFHWSSVDLLRLDGQTANILSNHARYNREEMDMIMNPNSKYISILRNPVSQFESSFFYFEFDRILRLNKTSNPIYEFMKFPDEYLYNLTIRLGDLPDTINLIQSGMFYDLGYDFMDMESDSAIQRALKKIDSEFQVVLITEYFDESLVLLKKELCWELDDILYIKQNQRLEKRNLTQRTKERIKQWNRADVMLYQYFNKTFWQKIKNYGPTFWNDVTEFKKVNKEFEKVCSPQRITTKGFKINVDVSSFIMDPKVDRYHRYLCNKVLKNEIEYLGYFKKKFGFNFGYQNLLKAQGMKPLNQERTLSKRLKNLKKQQNTLHLLKRKKGQTSNKIVMEELKNRLKTIL